MKKARVLIFVAHYLPGFMSGGPARSIANLVASLGYNYNLNIFTSNRDFGLDEPYPNVTSDTWIKIENATIFYASEKYNNYKGVKKQLTDNPYEIIYINSVFSKLYSIIPLFIAKIIIRSKSSIIIAPRGEFSAAAIEHKKYTKKTFLFLAKYLNLHSNIIWQASSEHEKSDIQREIGPDATILIARNIASSSSGVNANYVYRKANEPLRLVFLSRISPKKNLDYALKILQKVKSSVIFTICGPFEDIEYWEKCKFEIKKLPNNIKTNVIGPLPPEKISALLVRNDLLFFPTLGENFGHVIAESLAAGTPVLISDTTPWRDLENNNCGADFPLSDHNLFISYIEKMAGLSDESIKIQRECALKFAIDQKNSNSDIQANMNLFDFALKSFYQNIK